MKYNEICRILETANYRFHGYYDERIHRENIHVFIDDTHWCHLSWVVTDNSNEILAESIGFCEYITTNRIIDTLKGLAT